MNTGEEINSSAPPVVIVDDETTPLTPISRIFSSMRTPTILTNDSPQSSMSPASLCFQYKEENEQTGRELELCKHHNQQLKKSLEDEQQLREETEKEVEKLSTELKINVRKLETLEIIKNELATLRNENNEISSIIPDRNRLQTQNINLLEKCKDFIEIKNENILLKKELEKEIERRKESDSKVKYLVESKKENENNENEFLYLQEKNEFNKQQIENQVIEIENLKLEKEKFEQEINFLREDRRIKNNVDLNKDYELPLYEGENLGAVTELELQELKIKITEMEQTWLEPQSVLKIKQQNENMSSQVQSMEEKIEEYNQQNNLLRNENIELNSKVESFTKQNNELVLLNEEVTEKLNMAKMETVKLNSDWLKKEENWNLTEDKLKIEIEQILNHNKNLKNRLDHSENQVENLKENLKKTEEENISFLASVSLMEKQTEILIKEKNAATFEINHLEQELDDLKQERTKNLNEAQNVAEDNKNLKTEIVKQEILIAELKNKFENDINETRKYEDEKTKNENELKVNELCSQIDLLNNEITQYIEELKTKEEIIRNLNIQIQQFQNQIINKDNNETELLNEIEKFKTEKITLETESEILKKNTVEMETDLKEMASKLNLLAHNLSEIELERKIIVKERDEIQQHADNLTTQLTNAHQLIELKQAQANKVHNLEVTVENLNKEMELLKKNNQSLSNEKELRIKNEQKLSEHRNIVEDLTKTLETSDLQMKQLNNEKDEIKLNYLESVDNLEKMKKQFLELEKLNKTELTTFQAQKKEIRDLQIRVSETNFAKYEAQNLTGTLKNKLATLQKEFENSNHENDRVWEVVKHREAEIKSLQEKFNQKISTLEEQLKQRENEVKSIQDFKTSQQSIAFIDESVDSRILGSSYLTPTKLKRSQSEDKLCTPTNQNKYFEHLRAVSQDCLNDSMECEKVVKKRNLLPNVNLESTPSKKDQSRSCMSIESSLIGREVKDLFAYSTNDLSCSTQFPANITLDSNVTRNRGHDKNVTPRHATMATTQIQWLGAKSHIDAMMPTQDELEPHLYESSISTHFPHMVASTLNPPMGTSTYSNSQVGKSNFNPNTDTSNTSNPKVVQPTTSNPQMVMTTPIVDPLVRIAELQRRNVKAQAHLKSSYPIETQGKTPSKCDETVRIGDPRHTLERFGNSNRNLNSTLDIPHGIKRKSTKESSLAGSKTRRETLSTYSLQAPYQTSFNSFNNATSLNELSKENLEPRRNPRRESTMFEIPNTPPSGKEIRRSKRNKQAQDGAASTSKDLKTSNKIIGEKRTPSMLDRFRKPLRKKTAKK